MTMGRRRLRLTGRAIMPSRAAVRREAAAQLPILALLHQEASLRSARRRVSSLRCGPRRLTTWQLVQPEFVDDLGHLCEVRVLTRNGFAEREMQNDFECW